MNRHQHQSKGVGSDSFLSPILLRHFHDVFYETVGMTLLCELQPAIARAIDSLGKKPIKRVTDLFYLYAAKHINIAVDAFILLRREHRVDGARLIVRPALETMLRLRAVRAKPHLFYR